MSRTVAACGAMADALLGGISMFDAGGSFYLATAIVTGLSAAAAFTFIVAETMARSMELPDILPPLK